MGWGEDLRYFPAGIIKFRLFGDCSSDIFSSSPLFIWSSLYHVPEKGDNNITILRRDTKKKKKSNKKITIFVSLELVLCNVDLGTFGPAKNTNKENL